METTTKLETRRMGRTEMRPNALALGAAWMWQKPDTEVIGAIRRGIQLGINYIDTYPGASLGRGTLRWIEGKGLFASESRHTPGTTERFLRRWDTLECHKQPQKPSHGCP